MATSIRSHRTPVQVRRLGTLDYRSAWDLQRELADARVAGGPPDTLLLLQHPPPVYTAGRAPFLMSVPMSPVRTARR